MLDKKLKTSIKIYNTLTRKKQLLKPLKKNQINLFVCGPTVQDQPHLGHARTYLVYDFFVNFLRQLGFQVFYLQNITDIDDKIINKANQEGTTPVKIARRYEKIFHQQMKKLKINSVSQYARATEFIPQIISQVERMLAKGIAYQTSDGIYFSVEKFKDYGKLAKRTNLQAQDSVSRIDESLDKRNKADFCLWKFSKPGEPKWPSPWGEGRPGWHIEDTAISEYFFGPQYDIHGGAIDLIFPHHESEIAQMESISGKKPLVQIWMHTGFLLVNHQKMSKSLGNFITIAELSEKEKPETIRFFFASFHYQTPIDFSPQAFEQTKQAWEKLNQFYNQLLRLKPSRNTPSLPRLEKLIAETEKKFFANLADNFNTAKAFGLLFELSRKIHQLDPFLTRLSSRHQKQLLSLFEKINAIFKVFRKEKPEVIPRKITTLLAQREKLRKNKEWEAADKIRQEIEKMGWQIIDSPDKPILQKKKND